MEITNNTMEELAQYKERLRIALNAARICIFEVDLSRQLYTFFENAEVIFGVSGEKILRDVQPFSQLDPEAYRLVASEYFSHPDDVETIEMAFSRILNGKPAVYEARMKAAGSGFVWCRISVTPILDNGKPVRMVGVITDIADLKEKTDNLKHAVNLDGFTGLYNKGHTIALIRNALQKNPQAKHALVVLDIDNFKSFNDTYGHDEGDKVILSTARQLKKVFRETDIVGRFGGDEFMVLVRNMPDEQKLNSSLFDLLRLQMDGFISTNSIGISMFPQDAVTFDDLFKKADVALYHAKNQKAKFFYFSDLDRG